tara:strand:- start:44 stop:415 length:372 start_codon:yes stop_codon:yes gene_type:complete
MASRISFHVSLIASPELQKKLKQLKGIHLIEYAGTIGVRLRKSERIQGSNFFEQFDRYIKLKGSSSKTEDYDEVYKIITEHMEKVNWKPHSIEKLKKLAISLEETFPPEDLSRKKPIVLEETL